VHELKERGFAIMAKPQQHAWQQLPRETDKAYEAFVVYRNLEPRERSLSRVSSELAKSVPLIKRWSSQWEWVERARDWDNYQEMRRLEKRIEEKQQMDERHLKIIRAARNKAVEALTNMDTETLAKNAFELRNWISEFIKLERLVLGEPESIEERREKVEIKASIEEQIKEYAPVFQELLDEGAIRLDGQPALLAGENQDEGEDGEDEILTCDEPDDE
jgi:hypothetical protein